MVATYDGFARFDGVRFVPFCGRDGRLLGTPNSIRAVALGGSFVSPSMTAALLDRRDGPKRCGTRGRPSTI
jgi:hypothetical protein